MELAAVRAIAELAQAETSEQVALAYGIETISFGPEYIIPKPFDPRLIARVAPAVAQAAMDSGVATRPLADLDAYRESLSRFVYHSGVIMQPLFTAAKATPRRMVYAEGEDERVLRAAQIVVDEGLARPTLIGRPAGDRAAHRAARPARAARQGVRARQPGVRSALPRLLEDLPEADRAPRRHRRSYARVEMRRHNTLIGAMLMIKGEADGMLCGTFGTHAEHLHYIDQVIGLRAGVRHYAAMNALMLPATQRCSSATPTSRREPGRRAHRRDDGARRRGGAPLRHRAEGGAAVGARTSARRRSPPSRKMQQRARADPQSSPPSSRSTARCTATPRSRRRSG